MKEYPTVRGIGFDFGRVLANFDHKIALDKFGKLTGRTAEDMRGLIFASGLSNQYGSGEITSKEVYNKVSIAVGIHNLSYEAFADIWKSIFSSNPGIESVLKRIRPGIQKVIISNTDPVHWNSIRELPVIRSFFPDEKSWIRSYAIGARKPDPHIYTAALDRLQTTFPETLYIDDIPEYITVFENMGGIGEQYDCSRDSPDVLERILIQYDCLM